MHGCDRNVGYAEQSQTERLLQLVDVALLPAVRTESKNY